MTMLLVTVLLTVIVTIGAYCMSELSMATKERYDQMNQIMLKHKSIREAQDRAQKQIVDDMSKYFNGSWGIEDDQRLEEDWKKTWGKTWEH